MADSNKTLKLERITTEGFVNRGGDFQAGDKSTFLADRWVSEYFNVRTSGEPEQNQEKVRSAESSGLGEEHITLSKEIVKGFVDRGNNFRTDGATTQMADRWVSEYFNIRLKDQPKKA